MFILCQTAVGDKIQGIPQWRRWTSSPVACVASPSLGFGRTCVLLLVTDPSSCPETLCIAAATVGPHVLVLSSISGFPFGHHLWLLLWHCEAHSFPENDGLWREKTKGVYKEQYLRRMEVIKCNKNAGARRSYLGFQNFLNHFRAVKGYESIVGHFLSKIGVDPKGHNMCVSWTEKKKVASVQLLFFSTMELFCCCSVFFFKMKTYLRRTF